MLSMQNERKVDVSNRTYAAVCGGLLAILALVLWLASVPPAKAEADNYHVIPLHMPYWLKAEGLVNISNLKELPEGDMLPLVPMATINGVPVSLLAQADEMVRIEEEIEWTDESQTEATSIKLWLTVCYQWDEKLCRYEKRLIGYFGGERLYKLNIQALQTPYD